MEIQVGSLEVMEGRFNQMVSKFGKCKEGRPARGQTDCFASWCWRLATTPPHSGSWSLRAWRTFLTLLILLFSSDRFRIKVPDWNNDILLELYASSCVYDIECKSQLARFESSLVLVCQIAHVENSFYINELIRGYASVLRAFSLLWKCSHFVSFWYIIKCISFEKDYWLFKSMKVSLQYKSTELLIWCAYWLYIYLWCSQ